jgi:hypothetical protein
MDGERFDRLTKQLSTRRLTRLSVIRGLAVGAAAALTGTTISTDRAMAQQCKREGQNCEGGPEKCCPGTVCNGGENPTKCRACGGSGQFCCVSTTPCTAPGETCLPGGICGPAPCGGTGEPCCETGDECTAPEDICLSNDTCGPEGSCGGNGQPCCPGDICNESGQVCLPNDTCGTLPGVECKTGETALECCIRAVKGPCNRKQSSPTARRNCKRRGRKRCIAAFG